MKYNLFPRPDFLSYVKSIHIAYHPGRDKSQVARNLIMQVSGRECKRKYPAMKSSWELLGYDSPATIDVEYMNGSRKRFLADHYSKNEMHSIIDKWQYTSHLSKMKVASVERPNDEDWISLNISKLKIKTS